MNRQRRKELAAEIETLDKIYKELEYSKTNLLAKIEESKDRIQAIMDEEQEYRDGIPENLQDGQNAVNSDEALEYLTIAVDGLESFYMDFDAVDESEILDAVESLRSVVE